MLRTVLLSSLLLPILLPFGTLAKDDHHDDWSYEPELNNDPARWPMMFKDYCGGTAQSPIDIVTSEADYNDKLDEFVFSDNYDDPIIGAKIENNGHTIQISPGPNDTPRILDEGGLDDKYQFLQLHFHWGSDSKKGSEHTIDGQAFPLEMHLVHKNTDYPTVEKALKKEDGLAVLAVLFKLDDKDNPALEPIIDKLDDVRKEGSKAELADSFNLFSLMPDDLMPYYRYEGSLTTPRCNEVVQWTIFKDFVPISEKQLNLFRDVKEEDKVNEESLVDNFRPVQPLHGRVVQVSGEGDNGAVSIASPTAMLVLSVLAFLM